MNTYDIYFMQDDAYIGEVMAANVAEAERKASELFNVGSDEIYALNIKFRD